MNKLCEVKQKLPRYSKFGIIGNNSKITCRHQL